MPTEATQPHRDAQPSHPAMGNIKCSICGLGNFGTTSTSTSTSAFNEGIVVLSDPIQRVCGRCVNVPVPVPEARLRDAATGNDSLGLGLRGVTMQDGGSSVIDPESDGHTHASRIDPEKETPASSRSRSNTPSSLDGDHSFSQSLPAHPTLPWMTSAGKPLGAGTTSAAASASTSSSTRSTPSPSIKEKSEKTEVEAERPRNPLLDVTKTRIPSLGRGALYPGSVFKGSQTSGRSAYEVEIQLLDVNFAESSVSGYLSISHLTDSHPHLTTFFTGEIIGPKYGFLTGARYGASEHDDMRHWGRFEQFRRPATRQDMIRPELFFRDPLPDRSRGETRAKERDFVFLRIKERFLVPDHKVRDISGASFAGFYYAMVDLSPTTTLPESNSTPPSPTSPKTPLSPAPPPASAPAFRRQPSARPEGRRRESAGRLRDKEVRGEATIRGYYFHSLNQEPFQELCLTHVPQRSNSTFEFR